MTSGAENSVSGQNDRDVLGRPKFTTPRCGARTRKGDHAPCKLPAGFRTSHVGRGCCLYHGGASETHVSKARREEAAELAERSLARAMQIDPLSASELSVHLARGTVEFWRDKIRSESTPSQQTMQSYRLAVADLSRFSKNAIDGHVAERTLSITEREAEAVVAVCEAGLAALIEAGVKIGNAERTAYARGVEAAMREREDDPADGVIEGTVIALPVPVA